MENTATFRAAVRYVEKWRWSVIPLRPGTKIPALPSEKDSPEYNPTTFHRRLPTIDELKKWFQGTQNNIGIVTGQLSKLTVVDVDTKKSLIQLTGISFTTGVMTVISRRGRHLYFTYSGEMNSASKIAEHVDVRGEGGYIVAPPSVVEGHRYRFVQEFVSPKLLKPFPKGLLDDVSPSTEGATGVKRNEPGWISDALDEIASGGARTPNLVKVIGRLHYDGHVPDDIYALLTPVAKARDYDLTKLRSEIDDITTRYRQGKSVEVHAGGSQAGNQAEDITTFLDGDEVVEWLVPSVLAKSTIGFCAGLPETYKTFIMADLAIECSRSGGSWLGIPVAQCRVLFIDQERFKGETRRRFKKMIQAKGLNSDDLKDSLYIQVGSSIRLNLDDSFEAFRRKLAEIKPELVIIDSFATFHTAAENDRRDIQTVLERVKQLRQEFGCTFMFIDHEGKSVLNPDSAGEVPDAFKMVGSVGKPAAAETVLTVRKGKENSVMLYHTKSSLAPSIPPKHIQILDTPDGGIKVVCNG